MRDVPTYREQPASVALHGMWKQGWAARWGQGWGRGETANVAGSFWGESPVAEQVCTAAAGARKWGGGMIIFVMLWAFALYSSKSAPEAPIVPS